ncbi:MAG TPA: N-glycosylase/DNA lyase [archaeon]|nr:N-glycosylase/DNA lyase [archaeon]
MEEGLEKYVKKDYTGSLYDGLRQKHSEKRADIERRLQDFRDSYLKDDKHVFGELCFCLFTPQSKAKSCWQAIEKLKENGLLYNGTPEQIIKWVAAVRFNNNKSKYVVEARQLFTVNGELKIKDTLASLGDPLKMRKWLVKNVKGMGYKEAGHFLRNVGFGDDVAILDRHILKNMVKYGVISEIPKSLTEKKYLEIEAKFIEFADALGIPPAHLDLVFWSEEAGEIFK